MAAGNFIVDMVKLIDTWPTQDSLCNILGESKSNGGGPYNVLKNLSKLDAQLPLQALGCIGKDALGEYILQDCKAQQIDTALLMQTTQAPTSYTDVMTVQSDGRRTFFHNRGANAWLEPNHFELHRSKAKIFHLAYLMLLDRLDAQISDTHTGASEVLRWASDLQFITSADVVSENSGHFSEVVSKALPYLDFLFVNEYEASKITGLYTTDDQGNADKDLCAKACEALLDMGVRKWVVLHFPHGAIAFSKEREYLYQPSLKVSTAAIKGTVGAGDAFATGVLYGVHEGFSMQKSLLLGVCTAASCLFESTCSDGILPLDQTLVLADQFGFR